MEQVKHLMQRLIDNNYQAYVVGGAVRDICLGKEPKDWDLATSASPDQIASIFSDMKVNLVGKSFGVVIVEGIEIATFRADSYGGGGHKDVEVKSVQTIEEDLNRRDFTINAMAMNLDGSIIDPHNGRADLGDPSMIRFVGYPYHRIKEDPNRMLRACRLVAQVGGFLGRETEEAILTHKDLLGSHVAKERIRAELLKAMETDKPSRFFNTAFRTFLLNRFLPELAYQMGHTHGKHHIEDVWTHSMLVGDAMSPSDPLLRLAGYLHDIGKPEAWRRNGDGTFTGHDGIGNCVVRKRLLDLKFSLAEIERISGLVRTHMIDYRKLSARGMRKLVRRLDDRDVVFEDLMRLRLADRKGNVGKDPIPLSTIKAAVRGFRTAFGREEPGFGVKDLALNGNDIMDIMDISPGPWIGEALGFLLSAVVEEGVGINNSAELEHRLIAKFPREDQNEQQG